LQARREARTVVVAAAAAFRITISTWRSTTPRAGTVSPTETSSTPSHALAIEDAGEDHDRWLLIGPDRSGNFLEVVVMITVEDTHIVIHAMPMRDEYLRLLGL
jgi:hypothetical protein